MSEERLSEALASLKRTHGAHYMIHPEQVKPVLPTLERLLEPIPESVRLRFVDWVKSDSNELYDLVEIYRQYLLNGESK